MSRDGFILTTTGSKKTGRQNKILLKSLRPEKTRGNWNSGSGVAISSKLERGGGTLGGEKKKRFKIYRGVACTASKEAKAEGESNGLVQLQGKNACRGLILCTNRRKLY